MVIKRNFKKLYQDEADPWHIKDAKAPVYDKVLSAINNIKKEKFQKTLDLGCGKGAFTNKLSSLSEKTIGVELSDVAVKYAQKHHPQIKFITGDIFRLEHLNLIANSFDLITILDVLYYFPIKTIRKILDDIWDLLKDDGILVLRHWAPGGGYLTHSEWQELIRERFNVIKADFLETRHSLLVCRKKFINVVFSFDYETWQPIPKGKKIDWNKDIFESTEKSLNLANTYGVKLSFFAEMGEYYWCKKFLPKVAKKMENQWREIIKKGHDIQIHLHPIWLPECGAKYNREKDEWYWNKKYQRIYDLPIDIVEKVLKKSRSDLERILRPINPNYQGIVFRAGKYQIQPNKEIFETFNKVGILADSSVWKGGYSKEHHFDFRNAYSNCQPYFASKYNINYLAPWGEADILEIPITSRNGQRWLLDNCNFRELKNFIYPFLFPKKKSFLRFNLLRHSPDCFKNKFLNKIFAFGIKILNKIEELVNNTKGYSIIPNEDLVLVSIGHTKQNIDLHSIGKFLQYLQKYTSIKFQTINTVVREWKSKQTLRKNENYYSEHICQQINYDRQAILGEKRNWQQSFYAQNKISLDRTKILDLGCGTGYWTKKLNDKIAKTIGIDVSGEFIQKAKENYSNLEFYKMDFHKLDFLDNSFDCIYADNVLEHSPYPNKVFREIYRVLSDKGFFIALIPTDARNPQFSGLDHAWKTDKDEVQTRLKEIGFQHINIEEIDVVKKFKMSPYPASNNIMLVVTAWKQKERFSNEQRCKDVMHFVYNALSPEQLQRSNDDPTQILKEGYAWCAGYAAVMKYLCEKDGFKVRHYTLFVKNHPHGRGKKKTDTHEILEILVNNEWKIFDPTTNQYIDADLTSVLQTPSIIDDSIKGEAKDERWYQFHYDLYCSSYFYRLVYQIKLHQ